MSWKKTITTIVAGGFLFFFFRRPLEVLITSSIVEKVFDKIQVDAWTNMTFFALIILLIIWWGFKIWRRFIPSSKFTLVLVVVTALYSFYRWIDPVWNWIPLDGCKNIYYADLLFLILLGQVALHLCVLFRPEKIVKRWTQILFDLKLRKNVDVKAKLHEGFFCDEPIEDESEDILDFEEYAERLAKRILKTDSKRSFAIGINAKWGHGKTSFMTFLKSKIGKDIIEVNFDPWNSQNPESIISDFFENFDQALSPHSGSISRKLNLYAQRLSGKGFNSFISAIIGGLRLFSSIETIDDIRKSIQKDLKKIDKRIVVYIDDLDRLDQKEIVEVIRLIRNTADFQKTVFVVAYDREYIVQAIKGINEHDNRKFLEKIFQHEVNLPYYDKVVLRQQLFELISRCVRDETELENIRDMIIGDVQSRPEYLDEWLTNLRDVSRLANSILSNYFDVEDDLIFSELLRLELIRIKYPFLYREMILETDAYFQQGTSSDHNAILHLKKIDKKRLTEKFKDVPEFETVVHKFLFDNKKKYQIGVPEIDRIIDLLDGMFPDESGPFGFYQTSHLSIRRPGRFNQYFSYGLLKGRLPEGEFKRALNAGFDTFKSAINKFVLHELEFPLIKRLSEFNEFQNQEEFERIIRGIFHLGNLDSKRAEYTAHTKITYPVKDVYKKLNLSDKRVVLFYNGKEAYRKFLRSLLDSAKSPYSFESDFVNYAREQQLWNEFILAESELSEYSLRYLSEYLKTTSDLNSTVWGLYHETIKYRKVEVSRSTYRTLKEYSPEVRSLMKNFIAEKAIDSFILAIIDSDMYEHKNFGISNGVLNVFNDYEELHSFMKERKENGEYVPEFLEFYEACKKVNFGQYIPYDFKVIPVAEKFKNQ